MWPILWLGEKASCHIPAKNPSGSLSKKMICVVLCECCQCCESCESCVVGVVIVREGKKRTCRSFISMSLFTMVLNISKKSYM